MAPTIKELIDGNLENLNFLNMVIRNLIGRENIFIVDLAEKCKQLTGELINYETAVVELKKNAILVLIEDIGNIHAICVKNQGNFGNSADSLNLIEDAIGLIDKYENGKNPAHFLELLSNAKRRLNDTRAELDKDVNEIEKQKKRKDLNRYIDKYP